MRYKILVVDDDRELLKMLDSYFSLKSYLIVTADNGLEALWKIKENPDIILLDVNMPGLDGIEVCRRIRRKLRERAETEYIETVWGMGYKWIK